jgi:uncharacterized YigZ family protein
MRMLLSSPPFTQIIKGSRFLAELIPAATSTEAREIISLQKEQYADATHVVHAFAVGPTGGTLGCSDDGEPAGTAGRPVLEVLQGSGITNAVLTVTRWFGGTKLGTGGLVRAYSTSAQGVLATANSREIIPMAKLLFTVPYPLLENVKYSLGQLNFNILTEEYSGEGDTITGEIPEAEAPAIEKRLADISRGKITVER